MSKKVPVVKFTTPHAAAEVAGLPLEAIVAMGSASISGQIDVKRSENSPPTGLSRSG